MIKKTLFWIVLGGIALTFIILVLASFLYPIVSGIHYWIYTAPQKTGDIASPWSWGKNWCGYLIYQEKVPVNQIPSDCLALIEEEKITPIAPSIVKPATPETKQSEPVSTPEIISPQEISINNIVILINQERSKIGLKALKVNAKLKRAAQLKASDLIKKNYWTHTSPTGQSFEWVFDSVSYNYLYVGENLAKDYTNVNDIMNAWLNSPTHRANILNPHYTEIGVAVNQNIVVVEFGQPLTF